VNKSCVCNPYFTITILYPYHNLPYPYCYHHPAPTLPLFYPCLYYYYYYYYYYCDGSHIFDKLQ